MRAFLKIYPLHLVKVPLALSLIFYLVCSCYGAAQPSSPGNLAPGSVFPTLPSPVVHTPVVATYSGIPGERVVVGGEEKRVWSTAPRVVASPVPVPTYPLHPYIILPSGKQR